MIKPQRQLAWLEPGDTFPPSDSAWGPQEPVAGLLAAGGSLNVQTLLSAYAQGIFPWFSEGQPPLWWSPDPRMVLKTADFRLHRSLRKSLQSFTANEACEVRFDSAFNQVITACATKPREGQSGTWIVPSMVEAYQAMHEAGYAHSVETWQQGKLIGGLYCVNLGRMVFGESMFSYSPNASKIALTALVAFCRAKQIQMIDCQQNTAHLASLGAAEITRTNFIAELQQSTNAPAPVWTFEPLYWNQIFSSSRGQSRDAS